MKSKSKLSNCLFQNIYYYIFIPDSKIRISFYKNYTRVSFYLEIRNKYKLSFRRDKAKKKEVFYCFILNLITQLLIKRDYFSLSLFLIFNS